MKIKIVAVYCVNVVADLKLLAHNSICACKSEYIKDKVIFKI